MCYHSNGSSGSIINLVYRTGIIRRALVRRTSRKAALIIGMHQLTMNGRSRRWDAGIRAPELHAEFAVRF